MINVGDRGDDVFSIFIVIRKINVEQNVFLVLGMNRVKWIEKDLEGEFAFSGDFLKEWIK